MAGRQEGCVCWEWGFCCTELARRLCSLSTELYCFFWVVIDFLLLCVWIQCSVFVCTHAHAQDMCSYVCVYEGMGWRLENLPGGFLTSTISFLHSPGFLGSGSGPQPWWLVTSPAEPFYWLPFGSLITKNVCLGDACQLNVPLFITAICDYLQRFGKPLFLTYYKQTLFSVVSRTEAERVGSQLSREMLTGPVIDFSRYRARWAPSGKLHFRLNKRWRCSAWVSWRHERWATNQNLSPWKPSVFRSACTALGVHGNA